MRRKGHFRNLKNNSFHPVLVVFQMLPYLIVSQTVWLRQSKSYRTLARLSSSSARSCSSRAADCWSHCSSATRFNMRQASGSKVAACGIKRINFVNFSPRDLQNSVLHWLSPGRGSSRAQNLFFFSMSTVSWSSYHSYHSWHVKSQHHCLLVRAKRNGWVAGVAGMIITSYMSY